MNDESQLLVGPKMTELELFGRWAGSLVDENNRLEEDLADAKATIASLRKIIDCYSLITMP